MSHILHGITEKVVTSKCTVHLTVNRGRGHPPDCVVGRATDHVVPSVLQTGNPATVAVQSSHKLTGRSPPHLQTHTQIDGRW